MDSRGMEFQPLHGLSTSAETKDSAFPCSMLQVVSNLHKRKGERKRENTREEFLGEINKGTRTIIVYGILWFCKTSPCRVSLSGTQTVTCAFFCFLSFKHATLFQIRTYIIVQRYMYLRLSKCIYVFPKCETEQLYFWKAEVYAFISH